MREDLESELEGLLKRCRRLVVKEGLASPGNVPDLVRDVDALREELRCRAMFSPTPDRLLERVDDNCYDDSA